MRTARLAFQRSFVLLALILMGILAAPKTEALGEGLPKGKSSHRLGQSPRAADSGDETINTAGGSSSGSGGGLSSIFSGDSNYNDPSPSSSCRTSCGGGAAMTVDLRARCMCVNGSNCFKVDVGRGGPSWTTNGHGTLRGDVHGGKYQTHRETRTSGPRDNDAIRMGIGENDLRGKWIHKTRGKNCKTDGYSITDGCVAVPCAKWGVVKNQVGRSLSVCNGSPSGTAVGARKGGRRGNHR